MDVQYNKLTEVCTFIFSPNKQIVSQHLTVCIVYSLNKYIVTYLHCTYSKEKKIKMKIISHNNNQHELLNANTKLSLS